VDSVEGTGVIDVVGCCGEGLEQPATTTTRKLASKTILVISRRCPSAAIGSALSHVHVDSTTSLLLVAGHEATSSGGVYGA
jgi:hypothetical protein